MITRINKHNNHEVETRRIYDSPHYGELRCRDCNTHIQWLSKSDYKTVVDILYIIKPLTAAERRRQGIPARYL